MLLLDTAREEAEQRKHQDDDQDDPQNAQRVPSFPCALVLQRRTAEVGYAWRSLAESLAQTIRLDNVRAGTRSYARAMRAFALAELGDRLALDMFLRSEDAYAALDDALADDPSGLDFLYVAAVELDERNASVN